MNKIPPFEDAVALFRQFLAQEGCPSEILWVFREDIWKRSPGDVVLRVPSQESNLALAKKVFEEGRRKGLVEVHAISTIEDKVAATVWFPKFTGEEIQGWNRGMKLSKANPLPEAKCLGKSRWLAVRLQPQFRHYQRCEVCVGTKAWAAAQSV